MTEKSVEIINNKIQPILLQYSFFSICLPLSYFMVNDCALALAVQKQNPMPILKSRRKEINLVISIIFSCTACSVYECVLFLLGLLRHSHSHLYIAVYVRRGLCAIFFIHWQQQQQQQKYRDKRVVSFGRTTFYLLY